MLDIYGTRPLSWYADQAPDELWGEEGTEMVTATEREADFRRDLDALLQRHGAEMEVTDDGRGYGMHRGICRISMMSVYDGDELIKDYCEFNL